MCTPSCTFIGFWLSASLFSLWSDMICRLFMISSSHTTTYFPVLNTYSVFHLNSGYHLFDQTISRTNNPIRIHPRACAVTMSTAAPARPADKTVKRKQSDQSAQPREQEDAIENVVEYETPAAKKKARMQLDVVATSHTSSPGVKHAAAPQKEGEAKTAVALTEKQPAPAAVIVAAAAGQQEEKKQAETQALVVHEKVLPVVVQLQGLVANSLALFKQEEKASPYANLDEQVQFMNSKTNCNPLDAMRKAVALAHEVVKMMEFGKIKTNCIHTALLLHSLYYEEKVHPMELEFNADKLQVKRTKSEKRYRDLKEKNPMKQYKTKQVDAHINVSLKRPQSWGGHSLVIGAHCVTPFHRAAGFTKWGPTEETGVNGSYGRVLTPKAGPTKCDAATYSFSVDNAVFTDNAVDNNEDDPVLSWFLKMFVRGMFSVVVEKALLIKEAMLLARAAVVDHFTAKNQEVPKSNREQATVIAQLMRIKLDPVEGNKTGMSLNVSESVHRKVRVKFAEDGETALETEDMSKYVPPSPMFALPDSLIHATKFHAMTHRRIPMIRWRRASEVDPEIAKLPRGHPRAYKGAWVEVPFENAAVLGGNNVVSLLTLIGVYEDIDKTFGGTMKLAGISWLNTASDLAEQTQKGIEPVDPRFCMPGAGVYKGPLDQKREAEEAAQKKEKADKAAYDAHVAAQQATDDEMIAAADKAAAAAAAVPAKK